MNLPTETQIRQAQLTVKLTNVVRSILQDRSKKPDDYCADRFKFALREYLHQSDRDGFARCLRGIRYEHLNRIISLWQEAGELNTRRIVNPTHIDFGAVIDHSMYQDDPYKPAIILVLVGHFGGYENAAKFLTLLTTLTHRYDSKEGNEAGGSLHCFLEDLNTADHFLRPEFALSRNDWDAVVLAGLWLQIPEYVREGLLRISGSLPHGTERVRVFFDYVETVDLDREPLLDDDDPKVTPELLRSLIEDQIPQ